jgi:hypothetical protein
MIWAEIPREEWERHVGRFVRVYRHGKYLEGTFQYLREGWFALVISGYRWIWSDTSIETLEIPC